MENDQAQPNGTSFILLERFRDGDELAADALFSRYFDRLTAACSQPTVSRGWPAGPIRKIL